MGWAYLGGPSQRLGDMSSGFAPIAGGEGLTARTVGRFVVVKGSCGAEHAMSKEAALALSDWLLRHCTESADADFTIIDGEAP